MHQHRFPDFSLASLRVQNHVLPDDFGDFGKAQLLQDLRAGRRMVFTALQPVHFGNIVKPGSGRDFALVEPRPLPIQKPAKTQRDLTDPTAVFDDMPGHEEFFQKNQARLRGWNHFTLRLNHITLGDERATFTKVFAGKISGDLTKSENFANIFIYFHFEMDSNPQV
jgi:hypothetical protein